MIFPKIKKIFILSFLLISLLAVSWVVISSYALAASAWRSALVSWQKSYSSWAAAKEDEMEDFKNDAFLKMLEVNTVFLREMASNLLTSQQVVDDNTLELQQQATDQINKLDNYRQQFLEKGKIDDQIESALRDNLPEFEGLQRSIMATTLLKQQQELRDYLDSKIDEIDVRLLAAGNAKLDVNKEKEDYAVIVNKYSQITNTFDRVSDLWSKSTAITDESWRQGLQLLSVRQDVLRQVSDSSLVLVRSLEQLLIDFVPENTVVDFKNIAAVSSTTSSSAVQIDATTTTTTSTLPEIISSKGASSTPATSTNYSE